MASLTKQVLINITRVPGQMDPAKTMATAVCTSELVTYDLSFYLDSKLISLILITVFPMTILETITQF